MHGYVLMQKVAVMGRGREGSAEERGAPTMVCREQSCCSTQARIRASPAKAATVNKSPESQ